MQIPSVRTRRVARAATLAMLAIAALPGGCVGESAPTAPPVSATAPATAPAPAAPTARTASGAALEYPKVLRRVPEDLGRAARTLTLNKAGAAVDQSAAQINWKTLESKLERMQPDIEALLAVTAIDACTFSSDDFPPQDDKPAAGGVRLLQGARAAGPLLLADAARLLMKGDSAGCAARLAAAVALSRHFRDCHAPSEVGGLLLLGNLRHLEQLLPDMTTGVAGQKLDPADFGVVLAALDQLDPDNPTGMGGGDATATDARRKDAARLAAIKATLGAGNP